jgi:glycosyltransferase involved in cell wall biosynthesis
VSGELGLSNKNFRVVRIYCRFPPQPGGMELHIERLSEAQRALGVDVINVFNMGECEEHSVQILRSLNLDRIRPQSLRNLIFYLAAVISLRKLRIDTPIILHAHGAWSDFMFSRMLASATGARATFASMHGVVRPRWRWLYRTALSHCSAIFATGREEWEFLAHATKSDVLHCPSGITDDFLDAASGARPQKRFDIIDVANLVPKKRLDLVLECARIRPELQFAIVGEGPLRGQLETSIVAWKLNNVSLLGRLSPREVAHALRSSSVFFSPSEEEGAPTAALEAMACGLPVVLAPANDFSWLIAQGINGYVTSGWSPPELVARIDDVLRNERARTEMGERNQDRVNEFSWPQIAARVTALMREELKALTES